MYNDNFADINFIFSVPNMFKIIHLHFAYQIAKEKFINFHLLITFTSIFRSNFIFYSKIFIDFVVNIYILFTYSSIHLGLGGANRAEVQWLLTFQRRTSPVFHSFKF